MPTPDTLILCAGCKIQLGYVLDGFKAGDICDTCLSTGLEPYQQEPYHPDMVNHPPHYCTGKIEVLDFILDQKLSYLEGQIIKYVCRAKHKGKVKEDYQKAEFYLKRLIGGELK